MGFMKELALALFLVLGVAVCLTIVYCASVVVLDKFVRWRYRRANRRGRDIVGM